VRKSINIARVLALALLVAQFGAELHAYSHLATDPYGAPSSMQYCVKCLSFAPITTAVGSTPYAVLMNRCEAERVVPAVIASIPDRSPFPAFQPRAPPHLL
jgi:hypothetical protein